MGFIATNEKLETNWRKQTEIKIWIFRMRKEKEETEMKYKLIINLRAVITHLFGKVIFFGRPFKKR